MKKICFTVPEDHCEHVKTAMYDAGAGRFEGYDLQCWQVLGQAEFRPLAGSNPTVGETGKLEKVSEYKVKMFCAEEFVGRGNCGDERFSPLRRPPVRGFYN